MRQLHYTHDANRNLVEIAGHIAAESGSRDVAVTFTTRLRAKCRQIAALPATLGTARPELRPDIRSTPCQGYVIFFRYRAADAIEIVNILHGSRDIGSYFDHN
ncbi:type II toxin-antitoxin system RelE/ParE family toxin [Novosphingobium sp.]|uniref:type II toxin-antitoxin system RelE/ParE family toxin n=1 Tax=Novosphingobium sp. TaxID=1874826 RepID=UPI0033420FA9